MKITDVKEKEVVHCQTEAEAIRICNLMHEAGMKWASGRPYKERDLWDINQEHTAYYVSKGEYSRVRYCRSVGFKIIPSTEITAEDELVPAPEDLFESSHVDNIPYDPELEFAEGAFDPRYARPIMANEKSAITYLKKYKEKYVAFVDFGVVNAMYSQDNGRIYVTDYPIISEKGTGKIPSNKFLRDIINPANYFISEAEYAKMVSEVDEDTQKAERLNEGKLQWSLVDFPSLEPMVEVLGYGSLKYAPDNWKRGLPVRKQIDSLLRHVTAIASGVELDEESGLSHIGHAQCNLMFLAWTLKNKPELDDR